MITSSGESEVLDNVVGDVAAVVETLVDDHALLVDLREVVAVEVGEAAVSGVGQVHIAQFAVGKLVDHCFVMVDPALWRRSTRWESS